MMEQLAESIRDGQDDDDQGDFFPGFPMLQGGGFPIYPGGVIPGFNHLNTYRDPNGPFGSIYGQGWGQQMSVMPPQPPPRATGRPMFFWPTQPTTTLHPQRPQEFVQQAPPPPQPLPTTTTTTTIAPTTTSTTAPTTTTSTITTKTTTS